MMVIWIKNDERFSVRAHPFFESLKRFGNVEVRGCDTIEQCIPLLEGLPAKRFLIFYQVIDHFVAIKGLPNLLRLPEVLERFVLLSVGDLPFRRKVVRGDATGLVDEFPKVSKVPIVNLTGAGVGDKTIAGWGFVPMINNLSVFGDVPFEERNSEFRFVGAVRVDRQKFLRRFREHAPVSYDLQKGLKYNRHDGSFRFDENFPDEFLDDLSPQLEWNEYLRDMGGHKYSLAPLGFGHTFRFLESMAAGSLVISDDISHLRFSRDYFFEGYNYLSVGKNLERIEEIVYLCKEQPDKARLIAERGQKTFVKHFLFSQNSVPRSTLVPILEDLNGVLGQSVFQLIKT